MAAPNPGSPATGEKKRRPPREGQPAITKPSRLIAAAKAGEDNLIEEYLSDKTKNIDVNKVCPFHLTPPTHSSCIIFKKNLFLCFCLFLKKIIILKKKQVDSLGQTALHWACASGYPTTLQLLVRFGANIHARDKSGETPLHKAAWRGSVECVQALLALGADRAAVNGAGKTALDLCRVRDVRRLLVPPVEVEEDDEDADQEDPDSD